MRLVILVFFVLLPFTAHSEEALLFEGPPYPCDAVRPTDDGRLMTLKKLDLGNGLTLGPGGTLGRLQRHGVDVIADVRARCFGLKPAQ